VDLSLSRFFSERLRFANAPHVFATIYPPLYDLSLSFRDYPMIAVQTSSPFFSFVLDVYSP